MGYEAKKRAIAGVLVSFLNKVAHLMVRCQRRKGVVQRFPKHLVQTPPNARPLFSMVRMTRSQGPGAINLLSQQHPHHRMGQRHV